jgi:hypothetical protein
MAVVSSHRSQVNGGQSGDFQAAGGFPRESASPGGSDRSAGEGGFWQRVRKPRGIALFRHGNHAPASSDR